MWWIHAFLKALVETAKLLNQILAFVKVLWHRRADVGRKIAAILAVTRGLIAQTLKWLWSWARLLLLVLLMAVLAGIVVSKWRSRQLVFSISKAYHPTGKMGDIGDVGILRAAGEDQFNYETIGRGPHEWEWKYIDGELNDQPAQFGGVMYLQPPSVWGTDPNGGRDLRRAGRVIKWEARSDREEVYVEFVIGGINWMWDNKQHQRVTAPYPDSMPRTSLGTKRLANDWQDFRVDLREQGLEWDEYFSRVIGGFGWVISWAPNGISWNEKEKRPDTVKKFEIQIRNIRFERR
jgi:hypothetical protein